MNLELTTLQHFNFLVEDYDAGLEHFRAMFGAHVNLELDAAYLPDGVQAALLTIGPVIFELMAAKPGTRSSLRRLFERVGPGYIGVEFFVDDLAAARQAIVDHGIRMKYDTGAFFVAKPEDVFGLAIECYDADWYGAELPDPAMVPVAPRQYWEHDHPLGIVGIDCFTVAVRNRHAAASRWQQLTGCAVLPSDGSFKSLRAANTELRFVEVGEDPDVENLIAGSGERIHSVTLAVRDLEQAHLALRNSGIEAFRSVDGLVVVPAHANQGVRMEFALAGGRRATR